MHFIYKFFEIFKNRQNLKILLSAYACEPNKGSEPEVGWKWATTLPRLGHEVYVVTRSNNKENIQNYLNNNNISNLNFIYFDYPKWLIKIVKGKSNQYSYLYFLLWQLGIFFAVKPYIKKIKFDFIHHVTFVSLRYPSFLCLYKIPLIFGPISGGDVIPNKLRGKFTIVEKIKEFIRDLSNNYIKFSPLMNLTFLKSKKIFVNSEATKKIIPYKYHHKTELMIAIGNSDTVNTSLNFNKDRKKFNICYAGNLLRLKGISLAIETFNELKKINHNVFLTVAGSGPLESELKRKAKYYNIDQSISWLGQINRDKLFELFQNNDLLLMPSLRDSGGFVILEAMSFGLPVATLDLGGPGIIVDNDCGIKIDVSNKSENQIVLELASKINNLSKSNEKIFYKKRKSLERIKVFSWEQKGLTIYKNNKMI